MRKATEIKSDSAATESAPIARTFAVKKTTAPRIVAAEAIKSFLLKSTHKEALESTNQIQRYKNSIESHRANIQGYMRDIKTYTIQLKAIEQKNIVSLFSEADYTRISVMLERIKNLPWVETVSMRDNKIIVRTRALFADIRNGDGERETTRRCLGVYDFVFLFDSMMNIETRIHNALFTGTNFQHWAIKNKKPCLGSYLDEYQRITAQCDIYALLEMFYFYILNAQEDGGAYYTSHRWAQNERKSLINFQRPSQGDSIVPRDGDSIHDNNSGVYIPEGTYGSVIQVNPRDRENILVRFEYEYPTDTENDSEHDGEIFTFESWVGINRVMPAIIKPENRDPLTILDTMPLYSSLAECQHVMRGKALPS